MGTWFLRQLLRHVHTTLPAAQNPKPERGDAASSLGLCWAQAAIRHAQEPEPLQAVMAHCCSCMYLHAHLCCSRQQGTLAGQVGPFTGLARCAGSGQTSRAWLRSFPRLFQGSLAPPHAQDGGEGVGFLARLNELAGGACFLGCCLHRGGSGHRLCFASSCRGSGELVAAG